MSELKLISTKDGSYTLFNAQLNENYHSIHGARQESMHVFIEMGLNNELVNQKEIAILEIGTGTGMNAMLTIMNAGARKINYLGLEPYPIAKEILEDYITKNANGLEEFTNWSQLMTDNKWATANCSFEVIPIKIQDLKTTELYDLVYFDAFAPNKQSEMWDVGIFEAVFKLTKLNGILVTYCAQGQFKRNLKAAGFSVFSAIGPPGKREMTIAQKI